MDDDTLAIVDALADLGIIKGYVDGTFRPEAEVTCDDLAALTARVLAYLGAESQMSTARR